MFLELTTAGDDYFLGLGSPVVLSLPVCCFVMVIYSLLRRAEPPAMALIVNNKQVIKKPISVFNFANPSCAETACGEKNVFILPLLLKQRPARSLHNLSS